MIDRESQWFSLNFVKSATFRSTYCRLVRSSSAFFRCSLGKKSASFAAQFWFLGTPPTKSKGCVFFCVLHTGTKIHGETVGSKSTWPEMWGFHDPSFSHNDSERLVRCLQKKTNQVFCGFFLLIFWLWIWNVEFFIVCYSWCNNELVWIN